MTASPAKTAKEAAFGRTLAGMAGVGGPLGLGIAGAPWGVMVVLIALTLVITLVQSVFPQESAHRLAWWRSLWQSQERRFESGSSSKEVRAKRSPATRTQR
ncbi:hypothetical protein GCM10023074_40440 [Microbispora amethystogenes]|uniref:Uncharacterized protein n=1 Tax=Microbispora amethystogenes TaxID=1427754 RepID=A0ABQ4FDA9_9ACTN|nr:hypothetical protein Mam01_28880 [Microbispora amethystogenes]